MPKPTKGARLGGSPAHERIILANLASQLFEHGRITTTEAKAKRLRPLAEKLITKAKRGDIHARRTVLTTVHDKGVVHTLFTEIAPSFADRDGGYTRITKVGPRKGDNAPMAVIELITEAVGDKPTAPSRGGVAATPSRTGAAPPTSGVPAAGVAATAVAPATPPATAASESNEGSEAREPNEASDGSDGLPAGAPAANDLPAGEPVVIDGTEAPAEQLVGDTAVEQDIPSEDRPSDDIDAEDAGLQPERGES